MTDEPLHDAAGKAMAYIASFAVGFVDYLGNHNDLRRFSVGSGTFVKIDDRYCILTAAHVIHELKALAAAGRPEIGLIIFTPGNSTVSRVAMKLDPGLMLTIGAPPFTKNGPDLGLILLPPDTASTIESKCLFKDIVRDFEAEIKSKRSANKYFHIAVGVIAEWSEDVDPVPPTVRGVLFKALVAPGDVSDLVTRGNLDYCTFLPHDKSPTNPVSSYEGMSGGAIWRAFGNDDGSGSDLAFQTAIPDGVVFYQEPLPSGEM